MKPRLGPLIAALSLVPVAAPTASALCWNCRISGSEVLCLTADASDVGKQYCTDSTSCQPSGCTSTCKTSGDGCTGGTGGNCAVMADGTVICEEHKDVRTTNGDVWPERSQSTEGTRCAA